MKAKIIKTTKDTDGMCHRIDFGNGMILWFDVWNDTDGELTGDWNKYIFHTDHEQDMREQAFQNASNFETAMDLSYEYHDINN